MTHHDVGHQWEIISHKVEETHKIDLTNINET